MKTYELTGVALDRAVALAEGITDLVEKRGRMCMVEEWDPEKHCWDHSLEDWTMWMDYAPSQRWDQGGAIIERERITLSADEDGDDYVTPDEPWYAECGVFWDRGPTPLIAAMRAYVASKYGEEVPDWA